MGTLSLNEMSADQRAFGQIIKDDVNGFTSTSDVCSVYVSSCRLQFPVPASFFYPSACGLKNCNCGPSITLH
jgi:hypothetical protein